MKKRKEATQLILYRKKTIYVLTQNHNKMKVLNVLSLLLAMSFGFAANLQAQCTVNFTWSTNSSTIVFVANATGMNPSFTTYTWDYGDGQFGTGGPTNAHIYTASNMYYVCVTATDTLGCTATYCDTIWVNTGGGFLCNNPSAAFTSTTTPNGTHFVSTYGGFSGSPATPWYSWDFGNGATSNLANPSGVQLANGWHYVCLTIMDSVCSDTYCDTIFINNAGCAGFYAAAAANVSGNTATFVSTATGGTMPYTYFWQFGDGTSSILANPSHTYTAPGTYNVYLVVTDANGCNYTVFTNVTITVPCAQNQLRLTLVFDNYASETSWDLRDANNLIVASGANYTSNQNGTTLTQTFCLPTGCYTFNIYDAFGDGICCNYGQGSYTLTDLSNNAVLATGGQFTSAASNNVCVGGASNPCANFAATYQNIVNGNTVLFNSFVTGGTPAYTYSWQFGDGGTSNLANPTHTYTSPGAYGVFLIVSDTNGCNYTAYDTIVITAPCTGNNAYLTLYFDNYAAETSWDIRNANNGVVASGAGYSYTQNGTTITIPLCLVTGCYTLNVYDSYGDGMCCLYGNGSYTLTSGGGVTLASGGAFTYSESSTICVGGATNPCANFLATMAATNNNGVVQFFVTSNGTNVQYIWNFGDGTTGTGASATHTYANTTNTGYYVVCVTAYDALGCVYTACDTVVITPQPCTNNMVTLALNFDNFASETTWNITDANNTILYSGGGYTMNQNGTSLYQNFCLPTGCYTFNINDSYGDGICCAWGNGSYSLTAANGVVLASGGAFNYSQTTNICVGGATNPCANFYAVATYSANPNGVVQFVATATGGVAPYTYSWSFGSTVANPVYTYTTNGYYNACVVVTDASGCSSTTCLNVWINTSGTGGSPCSNLSLDMNITQDPFNPFNLLMQPVVNGAPANAAFDFVWDFGDGTGTMMGYPSHQYNNFGSYIVCIMAIDSFYGCAATYCDTITIDSSGNFSRTLDYKDVKPGFSVGTQTAIINYFTSVHTLATEGLDMELFPNPANEYINLGINSSENINGTITILDVTGKTLYESNMNVNAGYQQITLPTNQLVAGVYLVKVISDKAQQTMKFVKE